MINDLGVEVPTAGHFTAAALCMIGSKSMRHTPVGRAGLLTAWQSRSAPKVLGVRSARHGTPGCRPYCEGRPTTSTGGGQGHPGDSSDRFCSPNACLPCSEPRP